MKRLSLLLIAACGTVMPPDTTQPTEFIAFARDFDGYAAWEHFDFPGVGLKRGASLYAENVEDTVTLVPNGGFTSFQGDGPFLYAGTKVQYKASAVDSSLAVGASFNVKLVDLRRRLEETPEGRFRVQNKGDNNDPFAVPKPWPLPLYP